MKPILGVPIIQSMRFWYEDTPQVLSSLIARTDEIVLEVLPKKQAIVGSKEQVKVFELRLPLVLQRPEPDQSLEQYVQRINSPIVPYAVLLIQAGFSAIGVFEGGRVQQHTTVRTYMTRKKQGKNQLTYRGTGVRSKTSGGQLRYRNAIRFFEEINTKLIEIEKIKSSSRIFYSCPIKMWPYLFKSKVRCPFDKDDDRLFKIPFDVNTPNFDEMIRLNKRFLSGCLTIYSGSSIQIQTIVG